MTKAVVTKGTALFSHAEGVAVAKGVKVCNATALKVSNQEHCGISGVPEKKKGFSLNLNQNVS